MDEVQLDRQHRELEQSHVHAGRYAVQDHRRCPHGNDPAQMWCYGSHFDRVLYAQLLEDAIGTKFDVVPGYVAGQDIDLAVERGEVQCRAFTINAYFAREPFITWRKKNFVRVLYQTGSKRDPRLKDVPLLNELMNKYKTADNVRRLAKVVLAADEFGRPIVLPPGVPADRVKIMRDAFNKAVADPALLAEAEKRRLDMDPSPGEELESLAKEVMTATPDIVEKVKKMLGM